MISYICFIYKNGYYMLTEMNEKPPNQRRICQIGVNVTKAEKEVILEAKAKYEESKGRSVPMGKWIYIMSMRYLGGNLGRETNEESLQSEIDALDRAIAELNALRNAQYKLLIHESEDE